MDRCAVCTALLVSSLVLFSSLFLFYAGQQQTMAKTVNVRQTPPSTTNNDILGYFKSKANTNNNTQTRASIPTTSARSGLPDILGYFKSKANATNSSSNNNSKSQLPKTGSPLPTMTPRSGIVGKNSSRVSSESPVTAGKFLLYTNSTYGIKIQYPSTWNVNDTKLRNDIVEFTYQKSSSAYPPFIYIAKRPYNQSEALDAFIADKVQTDKMSFQNFTLIETNKNSFLAGYPGYEISYSYDQTGYNVTGPTILNKEVGFIIGSDLYYITYSSTSSDYSFYFKSIFLKMLDSLIFNLPRIKYAPQTNSSNQDIAGEI